MGSPFAVWPSNDSRVTLGSSLREAAAFARVVLAPDAFPDDAAPGRRRPVVVLPGFSSPDIGTARMRAFLARQDFAVYPWGQGLNIGPTRAIFSGLTGHLEKVRAQHGVAPALLGLSFGGTMAREFAKLRPDLVSHVITVVSPVRLPVPTTLAPLAFLASGLWDRDARTFRHQISVPPPMRLTALVSSNDGMVDFRACIPDPAPNVETIMFDGRHMTVGSNPTVQRIVAEKLSAP